MYLEPQDMRFYSQEKAPPKESEDEQGRAEHAPERGRSMLTRTS